MSWVKSIPYSGDDVFDEDADEISIQNKEWMSHLKKRLRDGFVDGIDAGEDAALQAGFNQGYREGAEKTVALGRLKGIVSAIQYWCQIEHPQTPVPASVIDLIRRVVQHEDILMAGMMKALETPLPNVHDVSESMDDLAVDPGGPDCEGEGCKEENCCGGGECMETSVPDQPHNLHSSSNDCLSNSGESLNHLLQCCIDIVLELGLPQELIQHLQSLKSTE
ncbi:OTU deubiquitinase with linear linkage specificity a [Polymixia lowei]